MHAHATTSSSHLLVAMSKLALATLSLTPKHSCSRVTRTGSNKTTHQCHHYHQHQDHQPHHRRHTSLRQQQHTRRHGRLTFCTLQPHHTGLLARHYSSNVLNPEPLLPTASSKPHWAAYQHPSLRSNDGIAKKRTDPLKSEKLLKKLDRALFLTVDAKEAFAVYSSLRRQPNIFENKSAMWFKRQTRLLELNFFHELNQVPILQAQLSEAKGAEDQRSILENTLSKGKESSHGTELQMFLLSNSRERWMILSDMELFLFPNDPRSVLLCEAVANSRSIAFVVSQGCQSRTNTTTTTDPRVGSESRHWNYRDALQPFETWAMKTFTTTPSRKDQEAAGLARAKLEGYLQRQMEEVLPKLIEDHTHLVRSIVFQFHEKFDFSPTGKMHQMLLKQMVQESEDKTKREHDTEGKWNQHGGGSLEHEGLRTKSNRYFVNHIAHAIDTMGHRLRSSSESQDSNLVGYTTLFMEFVVATKKRRKEASFFHRAPDPEKVKDEARLVLKAFSKIIEANSKERTQRHYAIMDSNWPTSSNPEHEKKIEGGNTVLYTILMQYISTIPTPLPGMLHLYRDMQRSSVAKPNVLTYNILLSACADQMDMDQGKQLWQEMSAAGILANKYVLTSYVRGWCLVGNMDEAEQLCKEARRQQREQDAVVKTISPSKDDQRFKQDWVESDSAVTTQFLDSLTVLYLMKGHSRIGNVNRVLELYREVSLGRWGWSVSANSDFLITVLESCGAAEEDQFVNQAHEIMNYTLDQLEAQHNAFATLTNGADVTNVKDARKQDTTTLSSVVKRSKDAALFAISDGVYCQWFTLLGKNQRTRELIPAWNRMLTDYATRPRDRTPTLKTINRVIDYLEDVQWGVREARVIRKQVQEMWPGSDWRNLRRDGNLFSMLE